MSKLRLDAAIRAACPIDGIGGSQGAIRIDFRPEATDGQRAAAQAVVDGFDWSDAAQVAWKRSQTRQAAASRMTDEGDPVVTATRNTMRIVHRLLRDVVAKVNELVGELNELATTSPKIEKLQAVRSWPQLLAAVQAQIAAETDPNS